MSIFHAIILGIIQGLTEFLPVSSSGHLIFFPKLFGWADQGVAFDVVLHLGTLVAVVIYFRVKLWHIFLAFFSIQNEKIKDQRSDISDYRKLGWLIILSIVPAALVGLFFGDWLETSFRAPMFVGINMIFWALVLYVADFRSRKLKAFESRASGRGVESKKNIDNLGWRTSLFIGCAQAIALIPGVSRSGITITAGMFSKLSKESAVEFTFLMSVPIIALAGLDGLLKIFKQGTGAISYFSLGAGFIVAVVSGWLAIDLLLKIIKKWSFTPFVIYRIIVGILILIFLI